MRLSNGYATHTSGIEPKCPPVDVQATRSSMPVDDAGRHAWEALGHEIRSETSTVASAAVHHLIVGFRPRSTVLVTSIHTIRLKNKGRIDTISPSDGLILCD